MAQTLQGESASKLWRGLTDSEAQGRLRQFGPNTLPAAHKATLFSIAFATLKEPMLVLLLSTEDTVGAPLSLADMPSSMPRPVLERIELKRMAGGPKPADGATATRTPAS